MMGRDEDLESEDVRSNLGSTINGCMSIVFLIKRYNNCNSGAVGRLKCKDAGT